MPKTSLLADEFIIRRVLNVSVLTNHKKSHPAHVRCRPSDALFYILQGCCTFRFDDGTSLTPEKGDILYLPEGARYLYA